MPRESRKRKAVSAEGEGKAEAATDSTAFCRGVLRNEARLKARISDLEEEVASLRQGPSDPDAVINKLLESLHHSGDVGILRRALQPNARRPRGKVRTLVLHDQAPELPTAMAAKEEKREIQARAITRSPRKRAGSAYSSAVSEAGEESAGDAAGDEKTETASIKSKNWNVLPSPGLSYRWALASSPASQFCFYSLAVAFTLPFPLERVGLDRKKVEPGPEDEFTLLVKGIMGHSEQFQRQAARLFAITEELLKENEQLRGMIKEQCAAGKSS